MQGDELRAAREASHWSRGELATRAGITIGRLAALELGHGKPPTPHEIAGLSGALLGATPEGMDTLQGLASAAVEDATPTPAPRPKKSTEAGAAALATLTEARAVDLDEWCGIKAGDKVKAVGKPKATFIFKRYVETKRGDRYVEAWGGTRGHNQFHALRPERVLNLKGQPVEQLHNTGSAPVHDPDAGAPVIVETEDI